jgi:hypothetical protein
MVSSTRRTAGCGPACPVVWEGRTGNRLPYPDCAEQESMATLNEEPARRGRDQGQDTNRTAKEEHPGRVPTRGVNECGESTELIQECEGTEN